MKKYFLLLALFLFVHTVFAQVEKTTDLYKIIMQHDSLLFNVGFNTCDIRQFETLLSDDFEFIHDRDSISHKQVFIAKLRSGLCKSPETYQSRRVLVEGSTEIYPLYKNKVLYGAVQ